MKEQDAYLERFQNLPGFNIHAMNKDGSKVQPWFDVTAEAILPDLVIDEINLAQHVETISAQIQKWGRLAALAKRVWQVEERAYRTWRSNFYLQVLEGVSGKKPTEKQIEAMYRSNADYAKCQIRIERAEEAFTATEMTVRALEAKKDMLKNYAYRNKEDGAPRLNV